MYHGFPFLCTSHNTWLKAGLQQLCIMIYFSMHGCFLLSNLLGLHCSISLYHIVQLLLIPVWLFILFFFFDLVCPLSFKPSLLLSVAKAMVFPPPPGPRSSPPYPAAKLCFSWLAPF